jgi:hypothetical protein
MSLNNNNLKGYIETSSNNSEIINDFEHEFNLQTLFTNMQANLNINPVKYFINNNTIDSFFKRQVEHEFERVLIEMMNNLSLVERQKVVDTMTNLITTTLLNEDDRPQYIIVNNVNAESIIKELGYVKYDFFLKDDPMINLSDQERQQIEQDQNKHFQNVDLSNVFIPPYPDHENFSSSSSSPANYPTWLYYVSKQPELTGFYMLPNVQPQFYTENIIKIIEMMNRLPQKTSSYAAFQTYNLNPQGNYLLENFASVNRFFIDKVNIFNHQEMHDLKFIYNLTGQSNVHPFVILVVQ